MRKYFFIIAAVIFLLILGLYLYNWKKNADRIIGQAQSPVHRVKPPEKKITIAVAGGDIFNKVGAKAGLNNQACYEIYSAVKSVYDLAKLNAGNNFVFYPDGNSQIFKIIYAVDDGQELIMEKSGAAWQARLENIIYEIKEKIVSGTIDSSLYESALKQRADERAVIKFAEGLEWAIDFALDPRAGDQYKFVYEERYRGGQYIMPGKVLAGAYLNNDKLYQTFYFEEAKDNKGFFDAAGNSVQKMFLKAPLAFKYISSPFTTGKRYVEAFNVSTGHRAVDYAATYGTPIRAVGDGTVTYAGWRSGYGNLTSLKHNSAYSTNYGHQSRIIVKRGQKVKQGQVIGYVGSTGFSTGPHLHFEMVKNGIKINPSSVISPPGKPIGKDKRPEFNNLVQQLKEKIKI